MRLRVALVPAAVALAAVTALPAHAAIYPVCAARVAAASAGETGSCFTDNAPQVAGMQVVRVIALEVATGAASASITCGTHVSSIPATGVGGTTSVTEDYTGACTARVTAAANLTTATVTSKFVLVPIIYHAS